LIKGGRRSIEVKVSGFEAQVRVRLLPKLCVSSERSFGINSAPKV